jgi:hypothetical protein
MTDLSEPVREQLERLWGRSNVSMLHSFDMEDIADTFDRLIQEGERLPVDPIRYYIRDKGASDGTIEWFGHAAEVITALHDARQRRG